MPSSPEALRDCVLKNHNIQTGKSLESKTKGKTNSPQNKKQREGCEKGALLAQAKETIGYLLSVLGWDRAERCKGAEQVISRQGMAVLKRMDHSRAMVLLASLFKSRLRQAITHEPDHEVFSSWTTEETARTDYLCLAGGISWWLIQLKSLTAHLSMGPFSLVRGLPCTNQLPPAQSSCKMMPATLQGRTEARQNCSPSAQRHPSLPSGYSLQCPSKAEQEVG